MGLLDDAIREHLELKRSHGADPTEVARLEREAFGPPEPARLATAALDEPGSFAADELEPPTRLHLAGEGDDFPGPDPGELEYREHLRHAVEPGDHLVPEDGPPRPHGDPADDFPPAPAAHEPLPPPPASPPPAHEPPPPISPASHEPPADDVGQPTREFDLDEVRAASADEPELVPADEEPEGEDVLEETPEFLQETPEHDRLWFEQRPPRDFDF